MHETRARRTLDHIMSSTLDWYSAESPSPHLIEVLLVSVDMAKRSDEGSFNKELAVIRSNECGLNKLRLE